MFWRKKNTAPASNTGGVQEIQPAVAPEGDREPILELAKKKKEKLPGAKRLTKAIMQHLTDQYRMDEDMTNALHIVMRKMPEKEKGYTYRVFDTEEAEAISFPIRDYTDLDRHPELILYEGSIDEDSGHIEMTERRKLEYDVPLLTVKEITEKIENLAEPGSSVFFYQARGPGAGGPLGRGAAIVELNPEYKNKKVSKYIVYTSNMVGKNLVGERRKLWRSNNIDKIAEWIKYAHHKRAY